MSNNEKTLENLQPEMMHQYNMNLAQRKLFSADDFDTPDAWRIHASEVRENVKRALGLHLYEACDLDARVTAVVDYGNYRVEKVVFESQPGVPVTSNLYVPVNLDGPAPAVVHPHGHWGFGRFSNDVQKRCIFLARLGFVSLTLDGWGFGERAVTGHRYEQGLCLVGASIAGLETWDNQRAVDYLCSRPEVDLKRIACTSCSGGGLQTALLAAVEKRLAAAVPVCYPSTWFSLFSTRISHCFCNFIPNLLRFADLPELLALFAPRPLLHITALQDQTFLASGARECFKRASAYWRLLGKEDNARYLEVDDKHGYSRPMREAMYGWLCYHLGNAATADPIPEPVVETETESSRTLWCMSGDLPENTVTASALGHRIALRMDRSELSADELRQKLKEDIFGGFPAVDPPNPVYRGSEQLAGGAKVERIVYSTEPGISISATIIGQMEKDKERPAILFLSQGAMAETAKDPIVSKLVSAGWAVMIPELRGRGQTHWPEDDVRGSDEYQTFSRSLLLGKPLMGQRVWDSLQSFGLLASRPGIDAERIGLLGYKSAGLIAMFAASMNGHVAGVATWEALASYIPAEPGAFSIDIAFSSYVGNILSIADLPQIAALVAPRPLMIANPSDNNNRPCKGLQSLYQPAVEAYSEHRAAKSFTVCHADQNACCDLITDWLKSNI